jgi:hypothetical protein
VHQVIFNQNMLKMIVELVLKNQVLPSSLETQINRIVWKQDFKKEDLEALDKLMDKIESGEIVYRG